MHMGGITTAGRYADEVNLTYILFDNEQNKSTGGQNSYQNHLNYINLANNSGFSARKETVEKVEELLESTKDIKGLSFIHVKCGLDDETPRPPLDEVKRSEFFSLIYKNSIKETD